MDLGGAIRGEITESSGPVSFMVKCSDGKLIRRHQDHLRHRRDEQALEQSNEASDDAWIDVSSNDETPENAETSDENAEIAQPAAEPQSIPRVEVTTEQSTRRQYPTRERRPPDRLRVNLQCTELLILLLIFVYCSLIIFVRGKEM